MTLLTVSCMTKLVIKLLYLYLSPREIPTANPNGFPEGLSYISPYISTKVTIQTFSISKSYTFSIVLHSRAILEESGSWGYIFPYCPVDEALWVRIDPEGWQGFFEGFPEGKTRGKSHEAALPGRGKARPSRLF